MRTDTCINPFPPPTPLKKMIVIGMVGVRGCLWADQLFFSQSKCDDKWVSSTLSGVSGPPTGNPLHPWAIPCEGKKRMLTSAENKANTLICKVHHIAGQNMNVKDWEVNIKVSDSYMSTASMLQLNVHTMLLYIQGVKLLFAVRDFDHQLHWYYSSDPEWLLCFGVWVKMLWTYNIKRS